MSDPSTAVAAATSSVSIAALATLWLGPSYGPYVAILFAAMAGAIWGVSAVPTVTRLQGAALFLRFTMTAVVLVGGGTAFAGSWVDTKFDHPIELSILVAFGIAAIGNRWMEIFSRLNPLALFKSKGSS